MIGSPPPSSSNARSARLVIPRSMPSVREYAAGSGLPSPTVVRNGVLLQFWTNPEGGSFTCGNRSKGRKSVHSVREVLPGTTPDQS